MKAGTKDLAALPDLGTKVASDIHAWCSDQHNINLVARLRRRGLNPQAKRCGARLKGKTLVITGRLNSMSRRAAKEAIRQQSGRATSSVSDATDYVVVGKQPGATKTRAAESRGVKVINEQEFEELLGLT
jgi:DNA ligase (NAD+)